MSLICFLDDSGTDAANSCVTMAGYVSTDEAWRDFESAAKPLLAELEGNPVHAMHMFTHKGKFKHRDSGKCAGFLRKVNPVLSPRVRMGVSFSTLKSTYEEGRIGTGNPQTPFGFCFQGLFEMMLKDEWFLQAAKATSVSFVIETGNKHNAGIKQAYERLRMRHKAELPFLGEMEIAPKDSSIAIQMADLFAYLTRRHAVQRELNNGHPIEQSEFLQILRNDIRDIVRTANKFFYE
jgi:hypothetical protein